MKEPMNTTKLLDAYKIEFDKRMIRRKAQNKRADFIMKKNEDLITYWESIPWYQFWKRPSFEEQRSIISSNWNNL